MKPENPEGVQQVKRVKNLTTLCILSFIGIILWIARDINFYLDYSAMAGALNKYSFLVGISLNMIILFGVVLMWKLKKIGFYIYSVFQILWVLFPYIAGTVIDTYFGFMILPVLISTPIFIVLYALNLKHMLR